jgi:hydrogenase maturation protein HypF
MTAVSGAGAVVRERVRVVGTVQGVGFRPFVYRLAGELGLSGWVLNDAHGVLLEVEGRGAAVEEFIARLDGAEAPPLAVIEGVARERVGSCGEIGFSIQASVGGVAGSVDAPVTVDTAPCSDCLRELFDPADRRYRYPFINCTNCGPRFTIVRGVPYDRPLTTMASFAMCRECRAEYEDPADRRFHAQPNACPVCGPSLSLSLSVVAGALARGAIVAIKGVGGFHLACRADDERVVALLRARKHREDKPFALMVQSVSDAERLVALGGAERELLCSVERPIVLAPRLPRACVATAVAPGAPELGVMLPYSPLHHLLMADLAALDVGALVLTSGNVSDEPIAFRDGDALARLGGIAELVLLHDRPIETRTDDSVRRVVSLAGRPASVFLRRSRGYVPASLPLPGAGAPVPLLACGAELKSTFCLAKGERAWISHHIGDLANYETLRSFTDGVTHFSRLFDLSPSVIVHDLHPEYLSTKFALEQDAVELIGVQHHHAHLAACLAEQGVSRPAVGVIFDGTGYGLDGTVWGGEILVGGLTSFERAGSLLPVRMPGGEAAIREPWRMACAWLEAAGVGGGDVGVAGIEPRAWEQVRSLVRSGVASPITSSMGRLFDAVAALCGVRSVVNYEGQAAVELEAACVDGAGVGAGVAGGYPVDVVGGDGGGFVIDPREAVRAVVADVASGVEVGEIASRFHAGVAAATVAACAWAAEAAGVGVVVLSGGVFQNRRLLEAVSDGVAAAGLRVLTPSLLPANDGGVSFGQASIAAATLWERR